MATLIYLASPYSHPRREVREQRAATAARVAASLMWRGMMVFSPVAHSHAVALAGALPAEFAFWREWCLEMLARCDEMLIIPMPGYEESAGIAAETARATELGKAVTVMSGIHE